MKSKKFLVSCLVVAFFLGGLYLLFPIINNQSCPQIRVKYSSSNEPIIEIQIEGSRYPVIFDSGSFQFISLNRNVLDKHKNEQIGTEKWFDFQGNPYESPIFRISEITIQNLNIKNIPAKEDQEEFAANSSLWGGKDEFSRDILPVGFLGRPLLEKTNLILDFPHSKMCFCNSIEDLGWKKRRFKNAIVVPFSVGVIGLTIQIETDLGINNFALDTGSTISALPPSFLEDRECEDMDNGFFAYKTSKFIISGTDFGNQHLYSIDLQADLKDIDGILGMDFMRKHMFFIDYPNRMLYIVQQAAAQNS